jgi:serine phosphatase RsbU (regulator of sigma subunit)
MGHLSYAQTAADSEFYLLSNLYYDSLYEEDQILLDTNLQHFHDHPTDDHIRVEALAVICENMYDPIWIKYQEFQLEYLDDITATNDDVYYQRAKANGLNNVGFYYDMEGDPDKALDYYHQSLELFSSINDNDGRAIACNNIGFIHNLEGNIPKAIEFYHKSLTISQKENNIAGVAFSSNNLGTIYDNKGDYNKALEYYTTSYEMEKEIGSREGEAISLSNMGYAHSNLGNQETALQYFLQAYEIREEVKDLSGMANSMNNIGSIYKQKESYEKAREYFLKGLEYTKKQGNKIGFITCYNNLASVELALGDYEKAKQYSDLSFSLAEETGYPSDLMSSSKIVSQVAEKLGDYKTAYQMHQLSVRMKDSLKNDKLTELTIQYQYELEYAKKVSADSIVQAEAMKVKNAEIAANQAEADKQRVKADSQKKYNYLLIAISVLFAVFAFVIFNRFRHSRRQNDIISKQKEEVENQRNKINNQHVLLAETHREISDSIKYAQHLQKAILPDLEEMKEFLGDGFVFFSPKDVVSGDFYWLHHLAEEDKVLLAVADCTGHGVPGAMVSVVCSNALNRSVKEFGLTQPAEILDKAKEIVIETFSKSGRHVRDGMDISLISYGKDELLYAGANNPLWIVRQREYSNVAEGINSLVFEGKTLMELPPNRQAVGLSEKALPFDQKQIKLEAGDSLILFTDGFADQFGGPRGKKFKYLPFKKLLLQLSHLTMDEQQLAIKKTFHDWKGDYEQIDDVCLVGVKV